MLSLNSIIHLLLHLPRCLGPYAFSSFLVWLSASWFPFLGNKERMILFFKGIYESWWSWVWFIWGEVFVVYSFLPMVVGQDLKFRGSDISFFSFVLQFLSCWIFYFIPRFSVAHLGFSLWNGFYDFVVISITFFHEQSALCIALLLARNLLLQS